MRTYLKKTASFTDIHFGAKLNSEQHNQDCVDFVDWFCEHVRNDKEIDNIVFMGDWFEQRNSVNIQTINYSYMAVKKLENLGLPVFFITGNHDLYYRHSRELYSTVHFNDLSNFQVFSTPTVIPYLGSEGTLICPFLFHNEYEQLVEFRNIPVWWGHFEFKGFIITGHNIKMMQGASSDDFSEPLRIFTGHFHKRQHKKNVSYIGNPFGTTYADAGDYDRGMMTYNYDTNTDSYFNWEAGPKYFKATLTDILGDESLIPNNAHVKCIVDVDISYEESKELRKAFAENYILRDFQLEETTDYATLDQNVSISESAMQDMNSLMVELLGSINSDNIDSEELVRIYTSLRGE